MNNLKQLLEKIIANLIPTSYEGKTGLNIYNNNSDKKIIQTAIGNICTAIDLF